MLVSICASGCLAQRGKDKRQKTVYQHVDATRRSDSAMRIVFYNVENLFDPLDDSLTADEEYQPTGMRGWTYTKLKRKIINLSKVITAVGGWEPPEIVGFCEIENRWVLTQLLTQTPLKNFGYKIIHRDSPDPRGIEVAMIYRPEKFKPVTIEPIRIIFPFDTAGRTRDILYVKGIACNRDTLHIFVNHWPSKFGGAMATIPKRIYAASVLKAHTDSLLKINPNTSIVIMGDLNDGPEDESVKKALNATMDSTQLAQTDLYDMLAGAGISWKRGTIKFRETWETIDHIIVTGAMVNLGGGSRLHTTPHSMHIFDPAFLLQDDEAWFGKKPFRTYYGAKYIGGFSDHLPVYADITY